VTSVDDPAADAGGKEPDEAPEPGDASSEEGSSRAAGADRAGRGLRGEALLAVELAGLCAFAFSRSVLDSFGRSPETFVARGADAVTVVGFGLLVTLVPVAVVAALGATARLLGARVRWWVHLALLGVLGGLAVWRLGQDVTGYPGGATKLLIAGCLAVPLFVVLRTRVPSSRSFLRYAGAASVIFLVQFLFMSPASTLIGGGTPGLDADVTRAVQAALGDDAPPVVFIVTDTFPTQALVDGTGNIDAELYPNLASLASTGTWYRNNTTVSGYTNEAVPALLSGLYPKPSEHQEFGVPYPNNLFTLLGGTYDLHVHEPMTRLCPEELCPREQSGSGLGLLAGDAVDLWLGSAEAESAKLDIPGLFLNDRYDDLEAWIDAQDFRRGPRPDLFFYHAMLPHEPWSFLPDGSVYEATDPPAGIFSRGWSSNGYDIGRQRLVLQAQATDRLLGRLFDRMRAAGTFDDAAIVVAGDHGQAFVPRQPWRAASEENYEQILWTPLIMKHPGQTAGEISDANVQTVDVLPTLADRIGIDLPFRTDGLVAGGADQRDPDVKLFDDVDSNRMRSSRGEPRLEVAARPGLEAVMAADPVPARGEDAVWKRTAHGDLVGRGVSDLRVGPSAGARVTLTDLGRYDDVDLGDPLPIEALGATAAPPGTVIAFALNGTIAGVTEVGGGTAVGQFVQSLLLPRLFVDGANELHAYQVEGPVGSATLRPIELVEPG
jgi:hypothetical protein